MAAEEAKRPHPVLVGFAVIGMLSLLALAVFLVFGFLIARNFTQLSGASDSATYLASLSANKAIAGIRLEGEISSASARDVLEKLKEASEDSRVVGILFDVNSPGGAVVPSQEIFDSIQRIKKSKPVVTYVHDMAASGAYYSSASSSAIFANRGSLVGSIGVIMQGIEAVELAKWAKVQPVTLKTGKLKDSGSPLREWTVDDKEYLQKLIEDTRAQFVKDVASERKLEPSTIQYLADGRVVLATQGVELKLVDSLGTEDDALKKISDLAGTKDVPKLYFLEEDKRLHFLISDLLGESKTLLKLAQIAKMLP